MKKGQPCRYCRTKVDAPGRHFEQRVPLLQTHVLQEAQQQRLDLTPRAYEAKPRATPTTSRSRRTQQIGLPAPVFVLEGFWLLAHRRNHCYANAALQILHWVMPAVSVPVLQEAYRASQLARITPEHHVLAAVTRGWTFDGNPARLCRVPERNTSQLTRHSGMQLGDTIPHGCGICGRRGRA